MSVCMPLPLITQTSKPTAVTLMFTSTWTRRLVFERRLKLKGTDIYVSDDFTKEQSTLLFHCRQLKRRDLILVCWSVNKKIMIRESNGQRPIEVHSFEELERMTGLTVPATQTENAGTTLQSQPQLMTEPQPNPSNTMPPMHSILSMLTPHPMYQSYYHAPLPAGHVPTTLHNMSQLSLPPLLYSWPHMPITCHHSLNLATLTVIQPKYPTERDKMPTTISYHNSLIILSIYQFIL